MTLDFKSPGPLAVAACAAAASSAAILLRQASSPVPPYGYGAQEYASHAARLEVVARWQDTREGLLEFLPLVDSEDPPLLHLLTGAVGRFSGHAAEDVLWTGVPWFLLLVAAVGIAAWALGGSLRAGAAAAAATAVIPAVHGAACRYGASLPATALLWTGVAIQLGLPSLRRGPGGPVARHLGASALAGLALLLATAIAWFALPWGAVLMLGAALAAPLPADWTPRRRAALRVSGLGVLGTVVLLPLALFISRSTESLSHFSGLFDAAAPAGGLGALLASPLPEQLQGAVGRALLELGDPSLLRVLWIPGALASSLLSPLGFALVGGLVLLWARGERPGLPLIATGLLGHAALLLLLFHSLDDRFVLPTLPLLILAATAAWDRLAPRPATAGATLALALGLAVGLDMHFGSPGLLDRELILSEGDEERGVPPLRLRGLGVAGSTGDSTWGRADEERASRAAFRETVWAAVTGCEWLYVGLAQQVVDERGDRRWWWYRELLRRVVEPETARPLVLLVMQRHEQQSFWWEQEDAMRRWDIANDRGDGSLPFPADAEGRVIQDKLPDVMLVVADAAELVDYSHLDGGRYRLGALLEDPDGGLPVAAWVHRSGTLPPEESACPVTP